MFQVVRFSLYTGRTLKVLRRGLTFADAEAYVAAYRERNGSPRIGYRVRRAA